MDDLVRQHHWSLLCAYRSSSVSGSEHAEALRRVCALHSSVLHGPGYEDVVTGHGQSIGPELVAEFPPSRRRRKKRGAS